MKLWRTHWTMVVAAPIVFFGIGYVTNGLVSNPPTSSADLAAWVGAIGTVGTLIGTIYLAQSGSRNIRSEKMALAHIHAPSVVFAVGVIGPVLEKAFESLATRRHDSELWKFWSRQIDQYALWTTEQMEAMVVVPNRVANRLADARECVRQVSETMKGGGLSDGQQIRALELLRLAKMNCINVQATLLGKWDEI